MTACDCGHDSEDHYGSGCAEPDCCCYRTPIEVEDSFWTDLWHLYLAVCDGPGAALYSEDAS